MMLSYSSSIVCLPVARCDFTDLLMFGGAKIDLLEDWLLETGICIREAVIIYCNSFVGNK